MTNKQALTVEAINHAFAGTNFGRDDLKNILAETVIDAAAGWRCGYTATTICTQLGLLTPKGRASALGLRFISEHVQRETKRLKDELEAAEKRLSEILKPNILLPVIDGMDEYQLRRVIKNCTENYSLLHSKWEAAEKRIAEMKELLQWSHDTLLEINPSNYTNDDVCEANAAAVEVILGIATTLGETHGKANEWRESRAAGIRINGEG